MSELNFGSGVSLSQVNPLNHALRNEYISNLITTCTICFATIDRFISKDISIVCGFKSKNSKVHQCNELNRYFCSGNAIEISFEGYELIGYIDVMKNWFKVIGDNNMSVLMLNDSMVFISNYDGKRGIYRYDGRMILISEC